MLFRTSFASPSFRSSTALTLLAASCTAALASTASAAPVIYEGFNGYTSNSNIVGQTPNANTVGLDTTTAYSNGSLAGFNVTSTGLTLGSLQVSGGAVTVSGGTSVAAAKVALGTSPFTGTLYTSYLVQLTSRGGGAGDGLALRVANDNSSSGDRLDSQADSRNSSTNPAIGYDGSGTNATNASTGLAPSTPYIIIARYTNVGSTIATGGATGTLYALNAAQFDSFAAGGQSDSYLDGANIGTGNSDVTARVSDATINAGTYSLANGNFMSLVSVNDSATIDEIRFGSTLADVTPTPEPGSIGLLVGSVVPLVLRRRRRA